MTDDGPAIASAVQLLNSLGSDATLLFESGKTYYIGSLSDKYLFRLNGNRGCIIDGGGSKFLLGVKASYLSVTDTSDCVFKNAEFDYETSPAFTASAVSVSAEQKKADLAAGRALMRADRDIGLADGEIYSSPIDSWWGVLNRTDSRYHMYMKKYEMVSREERTFYIYFTDDTNTRGWAGNGYLAASGMICPTPGWGHILERGFTVARNTDLKMQSVVIRSCSRFGMYIGQNEGTLIMDGVDFIPANASALNFTSWRDAFHVKDNRAKIIWQNCKASGNYDDVFNISASTLSVSYYNAAAGIINLKWKETGGNYYPIKPGDPLRVIDTATGLDCGTVTVKSVVSQKNGTDIISVNGSLSNIGSDLSGIAAYFTNRCAPGSVITDCDFNGTFRFRGPLTVENTKLYNMNIWIDVEKLIEGPVPGNILFSGCEISGKGNFYIDSYSKSENGYHIGDISFRNCILNDAKLRIGENDTSFVHLSGCKNSSGESISDR